MYPITQPATNAAGSLNTFDNIDIIDITYTKKSRFQMSDRPVMRSTRSAYDFISWYWNKVRKNIEEEIIALFLNHGNRVIKILPLFRQVPELTGTHLRLIMKEALHVGTCSILLVHMHPTEYISNSKTVQAFAKKIAQAADVFDISLNDYMVAYDPQQGYFSFADAGML